MFTTKTTLASYVPGIFTTEESKDADRLIANILKDLGLAETMAARAKAAAFKCRSNRANYERVLSQPDSKRRRAAIDKQQALRVNHFSARKLGDYALTRVISASKELIELLPAMRQAARYDNPSSDDRLSRASNCVLVARFLTGLPEYVAHLRSEWKIDEKDLPDLAHGGSDFVSLTQKFTDRGNEVDQLFGDPLEIYFVEGVEHKDYADMEERLGRLHVQVARANQVLQFFADAKSRYLNDEQFKARMAEATGPEGSKAILAEYESAMLDFEQARWALKMVETQLFYCLDALEKSMLYCKRHTSCGLEDAMLQSNKLHVRIEMVKARKVRSTINSVVDANRHDPRAYAANEAALAAIPAEFKLPDSHYWR
jgi:hypothetical protein